jgi:putative FmdB family regulatory protein
MPTYEYKCKSCENVQEEFHSFSITPQIKCNDCGADCEKIFSTGAGFVLKGGDWPSQNFKLKDQMSKKNAKMKTKMVERENSGEGVTKLADIK